MPNKILSTLKRGITLKKSIRFSFQSRNSIKYQKIYIFGIKICIKKFDYIFICNCAGKSLKDLKKDDTNYNTINA